MKEISVLDLGTCDLKLYQFHLLIKRFLNDIINPYYFSLS